METATEKAQEERSALDLYGGKKDVLRRMELLVRNKLSSISDEYRKYIYEELRGEKNTDKFIEFLDGKRSIDYETFGMLKDSYLEMSIDDFFGEPCFKDENTRDYWINQMHEKPMGIGGDTPKNPVDKNAELKFYVKIRANNKLILASRNQNN